jgi:hypothetical protein
MGWRAHRLAHGRAHRLAHGRTYRLAPWSHLHRVACLLVRRSGSWGRMIGRGATWRDVARWSLRRRSHVYDVDHLHGIKLLLAILGAPKADKKTVTTYKHPRTNIVPPKHFVLLNHLQWSQYIKWSVYDATSNACYFGMLRQLYHFVRIILPPR